MNFLIAIVALTIIYTLLADTIRKHAVIFYLISWASIPIIVWYYESKTFMQMPQWFNTGFMELFHRGVISTATFVIVMFLGCVTTHNTVTKRLTKIRGEISILGCIFALLHNIGFGIKYFVNFFTKFDMMNVQTKIATMLSMILIAIMIVLMITSYRCVRKKMNPATWKSVQSMAYLFFYLIYLHVMVLFSLNVKRFMIPMIVYSVIYALYTVLRIRKFFYVKNKKKNNK